MRAGWIKAVWSVLTLAVLMAGCGPGKASPPPSSPPSAPSAAFPTGRFVNGSYSWEFKSSGTFISSGPPGSETGTYTVNGNQIVITCQCCGDIQGAYAWSYKNNALVFVVLRDACANRRSVVTSGEWLKQP